MALAFAVKHYLQLLHRLQEFGYNVTYSLSTDNTGANDLVYNPQISDKSNYIQVVFHFTHKFVENRTIVFCTPYQKKTLLTFVLKQLLVQIFQFLKILL